MVVEGINVLAPNRLPRDGKEIPFVSDFFDFSIFLDADDSCHGSILACFSLTGFLARP